MNGLVLYVVLFASAVVVLTLVEVLDRHTCRTSHRMRGAFIGLICSAWWTFISCLYNRGVAAEPLVAILLALSILLVVDRRRHDP